MPQVFLLSIQYYDTACICIQVLSSDLLLLVELISYNMYTFAQVHIVLCIYIRTYIHSNFLKL